MLVSEAMAVWMSEEAGEALLRGQMAEISRAWRGGRSAGGRRGRGGREGSMGVVVERESGLRIEERTWLSWGERVWVVEAGVGYGEEAMFV